MAVELIRLTAEASLGAVSIEAHKLVTILRLLLWLLEVLGLDAAEDPAKLSARLPDEGLIGPLLRML